MNIKALGLSALMALAAPLSAQAVTTINAGDTIDILADNAFSFEFTNLSGFNDIHFMVENNTPNNVGAIAIQLTLVTSSADLPQLNWAASNLTYVQDDGFDGTPIASAPLVTVCSFGLCQVTGQVLTTLGAANGFTQFLNLGFGAGTGEIFAGSLTIAAVPLPASALLFMTALGGLGFLSRRKAA